MMEVVLASDWDWLGHWTWTD